MPRAIVHLDPEPGMEVENKTEVVRQIPKLPYQMSSDEIIKRVRVIESKIKQSVRNYEFYYTHELTNELNILKKELKKRKEESI